MLTHYPWSFAFELFRNRIESNGSLILNIPIYFQGLQDAVARAAAIVAVLVLAPGHVLVTADALAVIATGEAADMEVADMAAAVAVVMEVAVEDLEAAGKFTVCVMWNDFTKHFYDFFNRSCNFHCKLIWTWYLFSLP